MITGSYIPISENNELLSKIMGSGISVSRNKKFLSPASKINFFVGANNSGKSYFVRQLLRSIPTKADKEDSGIYNQKELTSLQNQLRSIIQKIENVLVSNGVESIQFSSLSPFWHKKGEEQIIRIISCSSSLLTNELFNFHPNEQYSIYEIIEIGKQVDAFLRQILKGNSGKNITVQFSIGKQSKGERVSRIHRLFTTLKEEDVRAFSQELSAYTWSKSVRRDWLYYIPVLRTLRTFSNLTNEYENPITQRNKVEYGLPDNSIIDGTLFFRALYQKNNSTQQGKQEIKDLENFLSETFFDSKPVSLISNTEDGKDHQKNQIKIIIDSEERFLEELGDGIQQLIILTYPIFFNEGGIIGIEEPEINLEPMMQRKLIQFYLQHPKATNFQFFITTHSTTILDSTLINENDCSIFRVRKINSPSEDTQNGLVTQTETKQNPPYSFTIKPPYFRIDYTPNLETEIINDLGVKPSSLLLANGIIWVEGPSDVIYIRTWLDLYQRSQCNEIRYAHGVHYEFQMYGGSLLRYIHYSQFPDNDDINALVNMLKINPHSYLVMDSDVFEGSREDVMESIKVKIKNALTDMFVWYDVTTPTIEMYIPKEEKYWKAEYNTQPYWDIQNPFKVRKGLSKTTFSQNTSVLWNNLYTNGEFNWSDFPPRLLVEIKKLMEIIILWNS